MANTKELSRPERRKAKRKSRRELKAIYHALTPKEKRDFIKQQEEDKIGLKAYVAAKKEEAAKAAESS